MYVCIHIIIHIISELLFETRPRCLVANRLLVYNTIGIKAPTYSLKLKPGAYLRNHFMQRTS